MQLKLTQKWIHCKPTIFQQKYWKEGTLMQTVESGWQKWAIVGSSTVTNAPPSWVGTIEKEEGCACAGALSTWQISVLLFQFCLELRTALKNIFLIKKNLKVNLYLLQIPPPPQPPVKELALLLRIHEQWSQSHHDGKWWVEFFFFKLMAPNLTLL